MMQAISKQVLQKAIPLDVSRGQLWLETVSIPLLAIILAWSFRPEDPLLITASFPWLWIAPILVALRYGVMSGLIAAFILFVHWIIIASLMKGGHAFPKDQFLGGILFVLLCGEFADVWRDRNLKLEETNLYLNERLTRLIRRHLLLNLSHDRLEHEMLSRPGSLRDVLAQMRDAILSAPSVADTLPELPKLLFLLAQYTNAQALAAYAVTGDGRTLLDAPLCSLGTTVPLSADDPLLIAALESKELAYVAELTDTQTSQQIVVAPICTSDHTILGVVAVSKLPFLALNVENLQLMSVILGYYADLVHDAPEISPLRERLPKIPISFAEELVRLQKLQKRFGITSQIVVMRFEKTHGKEIVDQLLPIRRSLDLYWQDNGISTVNLAVLMPFATRAAREGFLRRIDNWLSTRFDGDFEKLKIRVKGIDLADHDPVLFLVNQMKS